MTDRPGREGPSGADATAGWTDADWAEWFSGRVETNFRWRNLAESFDFETGFERQEEWATDLDTGAPDPELMQALEALERAVGGGSPGLGGAIGLGSADAGRLLADEFSRMSSESKQRFFDGWNRVTASEATLYPDLEGVPSAQAEDDKPPPVDSIVPELTPGAGLGRNWRLWAIPVVIAGFIVGWVWLGGSGSEDEAREALQTETTATSQAPPDEESGSEDPEPTSALPAGALPAETRASGPGVITEAYSGDDRPRISTALAEVRVSLGHSCRGGQILVSSGSDSEGPSGEFLPDGSGGFVWEDNTRRDLEDGVQLEDADEMGDVNLGDGMLSFRWTRTNLDGSTWTIAISLSAPEGAEDWWAGLDAAGPAPYAAEWQVEESDGSLMVTGTTDAPDGTVFEVLLPVSGDRFPVDVVDGLFQVTVPGATGSGGSSAQIVYGSHLLGCSTG